MIRRRFNGLGCFTLMVRDQKVSSKSFFCDATDFLFALFLRCTFGNCG